MKVRLYCVKDKVADYVMPPAPYRTDNAVLRAVERGIAKQEGADLEDFQVLFVGFFDDSTGTLTAVVPEVVVPSVSEEAE